MQVSPCTCNLQYYELCKLSRAYINCNFASSASSHWKTDKYASYAILTCITCNFTSYDFSLLSMNYHWDLSFCQSYKFNLHNLKFCKSCKLPNFVTCSCKWMTAGTCKIASYNCKLTFCNLQFWQKTCIFASYASRTCITCSFVVVTCISLLLTYTADYLFVCWNK